MGITEKVNLPLHISLLNIINFGDLSVAPTQLCGSITVTLLGFAGRCARDFNASSRLCTDK